MIKSVHFKNFKVLRDATLPLGRFTLIVGPNGSGKSTALQGLEVASRGVDFRGAVSAGIQLSATVQVEIDIHWGTPYDGIVTHTDCAANRSPERIQAHKFPNGKELRVDNPRSQIKLAKIQLPNGRELSVDDLHSLDRKLAKIQLYSFDTHAIVQPVQLTPDMSLGSDGAGLAGVLDRLRDNQPECFEALNQDLGRWFPDFDRILFDVPTAGNRTFLLRTREGRFAIPALDLSHGTLLALALLTLTYLPDPPSVICLEEPDRGIHPRLLRDIQDALYRLSYPESCGEKRDPVQVIATTHSPYFLDLYRDHPEEVVIAQKTKEGGLFERLSEQPHIMEILGDAPLGEVWYSGILGGVPAEQ